MTDSSHSSPGTAGGRAPRISPEVLYGLARQAPATPPEKVRQLRGTVVPGVERNSRVLIGPQQLLLAQLIGGPAAVLADGCAVIVTGAFLPDRHTTAQQGKPFRVDAAEPDTEPNRQFDASG